ncbi:MAG: hypothetical protein AVDCRST_MAG83-3118, partial [uncultured Arthrobacter sp.]
CLRTARAPPRPVRTIERRADPKATSGPGISAPPVAFGCAGRFQVHQPRRGPEDKGTTSAHHGDERTRMRPADPEYRPLLSLSGASTTRRTGGPKNDERPPWRRADPKATHGPEISAPPVAFGCACRFRVHRSLSGASTTPRTGRPRNDGRPPMATSGPGSDERTRKRRADPEATSGPGSDERTRKRRADPEYRPLRSLAGAPVVSGCWSLSNADGPEPPGMPVPSSDPVSTY